MEYPAIYHGSKISPLAPLGRDDREEPGREDRECPIVIPGLTGNLTGVERKVINNTKC